MGTAILALVGTIIATMLANAQNMSLNKQQYEQQQELMGIQNRMNENAAERADQRTRALYTDLQSPESMVQQYKDAGLSIGMMYGQGGAGGQLQQGAQSSGVSIPGKSILGMNSMFNTGDAVQAAQIAKTKAETEEINAKAELDKAQLPKVQQEIENLKQEVTESESRIQETNQKIENLVEEKLNIMADTTLKNNQAGLAKAQTSYYYALEKFQEAQEKLTNKEIEWYDKKSEAQISEWKAAARQYNANAKKMEVETDIMKEQKQDIINKFHAEAEIAAKENKNWDENKKKMWDKIKAETDHYNNMSLKEQEEWRKNKQKADYYSWIERNIGSGAAGFWQILVEDVIPF